MGWVPDFGIDTGWPAGAYSSGSLLEPPPMTLMIFSVIQSPLIGLLLWVTGLWAGVQLRLRVVEEEVLDLASICEAFTPVARSTAAGYLFLHVALGFACRNLSFFHCTHPSMFIPN